MRLKKFNEFNQNYGINNSELSIKMGSREIIGKVKDVVNDQIVLDYTDSQNIPRQMYIVYDDGKFWNAKTSNVEVLPLTKVDAMILNKIKQ